VRALASITTDDVRLFHHSILRPSESTLVAVGACDHEEIQRIAERVFADWSGAATVSVPPFTTLPEPPRLNVVSRPGAPQSELRIGHVAAARGTPDYHALVTANMILGGQFVSRVNLNLREDKGFTYGARTVFDFRRLPGPFVLQAGVQTEATAQAIRESFREIAGIRADRPVTADELTLARAALTRGYARNFETADQIARAVMQIALYDLPDSYFVDFVPEIERVTTEDVTAAVVRHLDPGRLTALVVGDLDVISSDLAALNLGDPAALSPDGF
jgi:zinc protease